MHQIAKLIILVGVILLVIGLILYFLGEKLNWIGHLPGDIRVEKENFKLYFPITTMLLFSILVTVIFRLVKYFFH